MDPIEDRFRAIKWNYADKDPMARAELTRRIAAVARSGGDLPTYSDLVRGVEFRLPNLREPVHVIDTADWEDLDRAIIGEFLGYISMESYAQGGFFASALVVSKTGGTPSEGFFNLLRDLGLIKDSRSTKAMLLWSAHVDLAQKWYTAHPNVAT
jgi:hypothetical protein